MGSRDWWVHQLQAQRGGEHGHLNPIFFVMPSRRCVAALRHRAAYGMGELRHHQTLDQKVGGSNPSGRAIFAGHSLVNDLALALTAQLIATRQ